MINNKGSLHSSESSLNKSHLVPHPPHQPKSNNEKSTVRHRRYHPRNQSSDSKSNHESSSLFDNREIKSAGCSTNSKSLKSKQELTKSTSKISSAPSPRTFQMEKNSGLYQFGSKPQLIGIKKDASQLLPDHPKKMSHPTNEPSPPPPINTTSIKPCISQASPIISDAANKLHKVNRRSLQKMPLDRLRSRIAKSLPESTVKQIMTMSTTIDFQYCQNQRNFIPEEKQGHFNDSIAENNESSSRGVTNWDKFNLPNNVSDSFEEKMLASLTAQCTRGEEKVIPLLLSHFLKSKEGTNHSSNHQFAHNQPSNLLHKTGNSLMHNSMTNKKVITPRTEALINSSYSDEESSQLTTGGLSNTGPSPLATIEPECCCCCSNVSPRKQQIPQDTVDCPNKNYNNSSNNISHDPQYQSNTSHQQSNYQHNHHQHTHPSNTHHHHQPSRRLHPPDFSREWRHQINCSQDTDFQDLTTDFTTSSSISSNSNEFLSVYYMHDFDCFYDPSTGIFYESNIAGGATTTISAI